MIDLPLTSIWLAPGSTDMRKSIDSLSVLAQVMVERAPITEHMFVFCNRRGDKIKILFWDRNGFWLFYKRLERGRFRWPSANSDQRISVDCRQLRWLLDGLEIGQAKALKAVNVRLAA